MLYDYSMHYTEHYMFEQSPNEKSIKTSALDAKNCRFVVLQIGNR